MIFYKTRDEFIKALPHNAVVAEIGVFRCENALRIIEETSPTELHLVDMWKNITSKGNYKVNNEWEKFYERAKTLGIVHRMNSVDAAKEFNDGYFDWIYVDAGHSYESCLADLEAWFPKVKDGGIIAGHDYSDTEETRKKGFGVKQAVDDFCKKYNLEIFALSGCLGQQDYAIKL